MRFFVYLLTFLLIGLASCSGPSDLKQIQAEQAELVPLLKAHSTYTFQVGFPTDFKNGSNDHEMGSQWNLQYNFTLAYNDLRRIMNAKGVSLPYKPTIVLTDIPAPYAPTDDTPGLIAYAGGLENDKKVELFFDNETFKVLAAGTTENKRAFMITLLHELGHDALNLRHDDSILMGSEVGYEATFEQFEKAIFEYAYAYQLRQAEIKRRNENPSLIEKAQDLFKSEDDEGSKGFQYNRN